MANSYWKSIQGWRTLTSDLRSLPTDNHFSVVIAHYFLGCKMHSIIAK